MLMTTSNGFLVMTEFIWRFANRCTAEPEIAPLLAAMPMAPEEPGNDAFRAEWLRCLEWVESGKAAQTGP